MSNCDRLFGRTGTTHVLLGSAIRRKYGSKQMLHIFYSRHGGLCSLARDTYGPCGGSKTSAINWRLAQHKAHCEGPIEGVAGCRCVNDFGMERFDLFFTCRGRQICATCAHLQNHPAYAFCEDGGCDSARLQCGRGATSISCKEGSLGLIRSEPGQLLQRACGNLPRWCWIENEWNIRIGANFRKVNNRFQRYL